MVWLWAVISGAVLQAFIPGIGSAPTLQDDVAFLQDGNKISEESSRNVDDLLDQLEGYLQDVLTDPWSNQESPILYVENLPAERPAAIFKDSEEVPSKRSRYYRKYPWKRQNSRSKIYDADRYLCNPSREDVFRLLVALHEARSGNSGRTISFCNRKRPAASVFNNIRFVGRK